MTTNEQLRHWRELPDSWAFPLLPHLHARITFFSDSDQKPELRSVEHFIEVLEVTREAFGGEPRAKQPALPAALRGDGPCDDCGTFDNLPWFTESPLWNAVVRDGFDAEPILCIYCFVKRAWAKGFDPPAWQLTYEWPWAVEQSA